MKNIRLVLLFLTLVISCAEKNDDKLKELQSEDFKNRVADKIAKKIPDYPKFGNKEQKVLAKDIVDIIANELSKKFNAPEDTILADVKEMLQDLSDKGFIEENG